MPRGRVRRPEPEKASAPQEPVTSTQDQPAHQDAAPAAPSVDTLDLHADVAPGQNLTEAERAVAEKALEIYRAMTAARFHGSEPGCSCSRVGEPPPSAQP